MKVGDLVTAQPLNRFTRYLGLVIRVDRFPPSIQQQEGSFMELPPANVVVLWQDGQEMIERETDLTVVS